MDESTEFGQYDHERAVARRVVAERKRRGMSRKDLAEAVTKQGHRMNASTPFKIEEGSPPRRITIDELVAFAKVFQLSLEELVSTSEVDAQRNRELAQRWAEIGRKDEVTRAAEQPAIVLELTNRLGGAQQATLFLREFLKQLHLQTVAEPAHGGEQDG